MVQECKYNPERDVQAVEQNGFIDLAKAYRNGSVPANLIADDVQYNGIDDPNSIAGRPSDTFDAAQMSKAVLGYKAPTAESSSTE